MEDNNLAEACAHLEHVRKQRVVKECRRDIRHRSKLALLRSDDARSRRPRRDDSKKNRQGWRRRGSGDCVRLGHAPSASATSSALVGTYAKVAGILCRMQRLEICNARSLRCDRQGGRVACRDCVLDPQWETRYEDRWEEI